MVSCDNYSANCCHKSCHNNMQWAVSRMYNQLLSLTPEQCFPTGKALSLYFNFFVYQLEFSPLNVLRCINNQHPFQCNICKGQIPISLPKSHVMLWRHLSDAAVVQGTKLEQVKLKVTSARITNIQPKRFSRFWCIWTLTTVPLWFYHTFLCIAQWSRCQVGCSGSQNLPCSDYWRIICPCSNYMEHPKILP